MLRHLTLVALLACSSCASTTPKDLQALLVEGLPRIAHVIERAQKAYDRIDRVYVALCDGRETSEECRFLRNEADAVVRELNDLLKLYSDTNKVVQDAVKP